MAGLNDDVVRLHDPFGDVDAAFEVASEFVIDESGDLHLILFRRFETRVGEAFRERAVVGEKDKAFAVLVETTDREETAELFRNEIENAPSPLRVAVGAKGVFRFIESEVNRFRFRERFAVDADSLFVREDADAKFRNDDAVDFDAPFGDEFLALASTSVAGRGENFLQAMPEFFGERIVRVDRFRLFHRSVRKNGIGRGAFATRIRETRTAGFRSARGIEARFAIPRLRLWARVSGTSHRNLRKKVDASKNAPLKNKRLENAIIL
jgi:hypothetical protein